MAVWLLNCRRPQWAIFLSVPPTPFIFSSAGGTWSCTVKNESKSYFYMHWRLISWTNIFWSSVIFHFIEEFLDCRLCLSLRMTLFSSSLPGHVCLFWALLAFPPPYVFFSLWLGWRVQARLLHCWHLSEKKKEVVLLWGIQHCETDCVVSGQSCLPPRCMQPPHGPFLSLVGAYVFHGHCEQNESGRVWPPCWFQTFDTGCGEMDSVGVYCFWGVEVEHWCESWGTGNPNLRTSSRQPFPLPPAQCPHGPHPHCQ